MRARVESRPRRAERDNKEIARSEFANLVGLEAMRGAHLWSLQDNVRCPTPVRRGAESEPLLAERRKSGRSPAARVAVAEVGHAPWLMSNHRLA